jgi:hypothetical protein
MQSTNNKLFSITQYHLIPKMYREYMKLSIDFQSSVALYLGSSHDHNDRSFHIHFWTTEKSNIDHEEA